MKENNALPCHKSLDCWYRYFPVSQFLRQELTEMEWEKIFNQTPRPKILNILESIEKAKKLKPEK